ncbi:MerR family transcriptional regulator [Paraflavitalea sp. CAU 1676]|uniref:MerR family transcriptional regulator n=1 Tax=Paraflavitalea sp. CAU 1676 TaxID=3032598 RepID=UPI0023DB3B10|nr:MerR family transcriptional regulator [Paraflavitalea sp. CAU 1676]MDF2191315.1 MerR family transcriptional regulator [Paraflavitalea sp. CAU 1676]
MLIGELAKKSGLTRDTIRFYEKQGLIKVGWRERRENNYKEYSAGVLRRLLLFKKIKSYGFTLQECAEIISLIDANLASCDRVSKAADDKIIAIESKIQELQALKNLLRTSVDACLSGCCANKEDDNCQLFDLEDAAKGQ